MASVTGKKQYNRGKIHFFHAIKFPRNFIEDK